MTIHLHKIAKIREMDCIGCTKCIQACPFDAILGSSKLMHTVISKECTGCGLCIDPCPMDCIEMHEISSREPANNAHHRQRAQFREARLKRIEAEKQFSQLLQKNAGQMDAEAEIIAKKAYIKAAIARTEVYKLSKKNDANKN